MKNKGEENMERVIELFNKIRETSSTNEKVNIIKANNDNELFNSCLRFLLDDMIITGISDAKINKSVYGVVDKIETFMDMIEYLKLNKTGRDEDILKVKVFIDNQPLEHQEFYKQMITKSLKLGCDAKLVNKAIPDLIPTFDLMLGTPIDKCKLKGDERISISRKLNGCRCAFIGGKLKTRQGKEYIGLDHIIDEINKCGLSNFFIDGELIYKNEEGLSDSEAFQKGTGIAMSKDGDKSCLKLVIFDMFYPEESVNYSVRSKSLMVYNEYVKCKGGIEYIEFLTPLYQGYDHSQIWKLLDYAEENDWEGVMVNLNTPYEFKRTKNLIKVKKFYTYDLKVVDVEEGVGKNKGKLGALVVDFKGNLVNVGSGFTDEEREYFWNNKESIIGRVIEIKYKEITKDKKSGLESLQFPVFVNLREFGKEESYN